MKKLMLSTALVGALVSGSALAQTTITGELRLNYKATGSSVASGTTTSSQRGFGSEQQINVQTKGKLNVGGLEYAAGFSIEFDGKKIKSMIEELQATGNWTFTFVGANIDSISTAKNYGISTHNVVQFSADEISNAKVYKSMSKSFKTRAMAMDSGSYDSDSFISDEDKDITTK
jgi:hypothetical protein